MIDNYRNFNDDRFPEEPDKPERPPTPADIHNKNIADKLRTHDRETLSLYGSPAVRAAIIERIQ